MGQVRQASIGTSRGARIDGRGVVAQQHRERSGAQSDPGLSQKRAPLDQQALAYKAWIGHRCFLLEPQLRVSVSLKFKMARATIVHEASCAWFKSLGIGVSPTASNRSASL